MKKLMIAFAALAACSSTTAPSVPPAPNRAIEFMAMFDKTATCTSWGATTGSGGSVDVAMCKLNDVLLYCTGGVGQRPKCEVAANLRPQPPAPQAPPPAPPPAPPAEGSGSGK